MTMDLKHIQGIIWDLDGTLYRFDELFKTACNHAAAKVASTVRPEFTYDVSLERCIISEREHGFSLHWFHEETKLTFDALHFVYHEALDEKVIARNEEMGAGLRALTIPSVLLTNASRDWAMRTTKHLMIDDIFGDRNILALEDADFVPKSRGKVGFEKAIALLGLAPEKILVIEDLPRNLITAKTMGLNTALLHHGQIPADVSAADFLFQDAVEVISALNNKPSPDLSIQHSALHR